MSHKGKATSDVSFSLEDGPQEYTNPSIHSRISEYTSAARSVHGPDFDPCTQEIDTELVMRLGGGKKHGRMWIADGTIDSIAVLDLSMIQAQSMSESPAIRTWSTIAQ